MIRIRYATLPEGLHAQARRENGHTILYLRPGLSSEQRREALRRARQTARMGHGPRLPAAGVALALAADRTRWTLRNVVAAARHHPVGAGMLAALVAGGVVSYSLFVTVTVHLISPQIQTLPPNLPHPTVSVPAPVPAGGSRPRSPGAKPGGSAGGGSSYPTSTVASVPVTGSPGSGRSPTPAPPGPSPSPSPSSPTPSGGGGGGGGTGLCLTVGPLGVCISL